ncbi:MAG TPA: DUF423 domain-containing protein, partial [Rhizobiales bacterium]|nr:DUF423 domain-containing protein [Hyphomicrobiales bacterium]
SVLIAAIGLSLWAPLPHTLKRRLGLAGWVFVAGIVLFATPVFLAAFTGSRAIIMATPVGGLTLMAGWALLIWAAAKKP